MHPILARLERLGGYLALWCAIGVFESGVLTRQGLTWPEALVQVLPPLLVYSFVCLSAWYVCRATPLATSDVSRVLTASIVAAFVAAALWLALSEAWLATLESMPELSPVTSRFRTQVPFLFAVSVMLYLLVLSVHYVVLSFEAFRTAERQQLELQVLTRDAELRALRAQIDPHFLYNCLNSISALTGSDAPAARRMCLLLAEFLRTTLRVSTQQSITMAEELSLADRFLSIEQVRFGERLQIERSIDDSALECHVPPLVLQPLLENAVGHGIASMVDGGTIRLDVVRRGDRVSITVENPRDPDAVPRKRGGVGLENVRKRLALVFGGAARMDAAANPTGFRVAIDLPVPSMPEPTSLPLRIAVVDDEPLARQVLCEFLAAEPHVEVVAQCANGFEAVKAVSELTPDLLLLDVQMPKLDGFEVLDLVGGDVAVVFTTAYDQYALRAFEVHAVDYLLKPISAERLSEALARVRERLGRGERAASPGTRAGAMAAATREGHAHRVLVRDGPRVHVIPVDKIDYVQAQDDYVCFRSEGKDYLKEQTLAETETSLDPAVFVRIHRSYLLNLSRLARVDQDERENRVAVLTDGRRLPVSRAGYTRLSSLL